MSTHHLIDVACDGEVQLILHCINAGCLEHSHVSHHASQGRLPVLDQYALQELEAVLTDGSVRCEQHQRQCIAGEDAPQHT